MITKKRPLLTLSTPLEDIPRRWLELVEAKIERRKGSSCWLWTGAVDTEGEPVLNYLNLATGKRNTRRVKRLMAEVFWEMKPHYDVLHQCGDLTCLNPNHWTISTAHWTSR